jgi:hypothetical protein
MVSLTKGRRFLETGTEPYRSSGECSRQIACAWAGDANLAWAEGSPETHSSIRTPVPR